MKSITSNHLGRWADDIKLWGFRHGTKEVKTDNIKKNSSVTDYFHGNMAVRNFIYGMVVSIK